MVAGVTVAISATVISGVMVMIEVLETAGERLQTTESQNAWRCAGAKIDMIPNV
jgi:hypothetical protein